MSVKRGVRRLLSRESVKLILDTLSKHPEILVNLKEEHGEYLDLELLFDFLKQEEINGTKAVG
jgi:hypothetical protein